MSRKDKKIDRDDRRNLLSYAEEVIDKEYVDKTIEEIKKDLEKLDMEKYTSYTEKKESSIRKLYYKIKGGFEKYKPLFKYVLPSIGISLAYYLFVPRIFDHFAITSIPNELMEYKSFIEESLREKGFNYVEVISQDQANNIKYAAKLFSQDSSKSINFPLYFTLLNPEFAQVTSIILPSMLTWYLNKRRRYTLPIVTSLFIGMGLYVLISFPLSIISEMILFDKIYQHPQLFYLVPDTISSLLSNIYNPNPLVSVRNLGVLFYSLISTLLTTIVSLWKRRRDIISMYNL